MIAAKPGFKDVLRAGRYAVSHPILSAHAVFRAYRSDQLYGESNSCLKQRNFPRPSHRLTHIAAFLKGNAGDTLLPVVLRDLFTSVGGMQYSWELRHAHPRFSDWDVRKANGTKGIVIGGGGLFLRDTNPNTNSGWQWNCPISQLNVITKPIVLFAVGYNRFRGQQDFSPIFAEHLSVLAEKSVYIGLRNEGSINAIKSYLPTDLHYKVRYQPCMTTLLSHLYSHLLTTPEKKHARPPVIAVNAAFDRASLRFGHNEIKTLERLANALKLACSGAAVQVAVHCPDDAQILPFLRGVGLPHERVNLVNATPSQIIEYYSSVDLAIGMRGHSQLIPFGCVTPIVSLVTHDKLQWFLDDIKRPKWGVDVNDADLDLRLQEVVAEILGDPESTKADIASIQRQLWDVSVRNVFDAITAFGCPVPHKRTLSIAGNSNS